MQVLSYPRNHVMVCLIACLKLHIIKQPIHEAHYKYKYGIKNDLKHIFKDFRLFPAHRVVNLLKKAWNACSKDDPMGHSFKETESAVGNGQILGASPTSRAGFQRASHTNTNMHKPALTHLIA